MRPACPQLAEADLRLIWGEAGFDPNSDPRRNNSNSNSEQLRSAPRTCRHVGGRLSLRPIDQVAVVLEDGRCRLMKITGRWLTGPRISPLRALPPAYAHALLALRLEYMALAARLGQPAEMHQESAGFGQQVEMQQEPAGFGVGRQEVPRLGIYLRREG